MTLFKKRATESRRRTISHHLNSYILLELKDKTIHHIREIKRLPTHLTLAATELLRMDSILQLNPGYWIRSCLKRGKAEQTMRRWSRIIGHKAPHTVLRALLRHIMHSSRKIFDNGFILIRRNGEHSSTSDPLGPHITTQWHGEATSLTWELLTFTHWRILTFTRHHPLRIPPIIPLARCHEQVVGQSLFESVFLLHVVALLSFLQSSLSNVLFEKLCR